MNVNIKKLDWDLRLQSLFVGSFVANFLGHSFTVSRDYVENGLEWVWKGTCSGPDCGPFSTAEEAMNAVESWYASLVFSCLDPCDKETDDDLQN